MLVLDAGLSRGGAWRSLRVALVKWERLARRVPVTSGGVAAWALRGGTGRQAPWTVLRVNEIPAEPRPPIPPGRQTTGDR
jgi:hypothetical protein